MKAASTSKRYFAATKMLVINPHAEASTTIPSIHHASLGELPSYLNKGDLVIVNRSGTLPASFRGVLKRTCEPIEIRLSAFRGASSRDLSRWAAVPFGAGDWRLPTEERGPAPTLQVNDEIMIGHDLQAKVTAIDSRSPRLIEIEFVSTSSLTQKLFEHGRPIQYSYMREDLEVWDQQTIYAGAPISVEPPSSAFPFTWQMMLQMKSLGIHVESLLHGAGLSSTGDVELDRKLPLEEYFEVPQKTVTAILNAQKEGKQVIAIGTSVARALETVFAESNHFRLSGYTNLKIGPETKLRATTAILTGMHEDGTSHAELMKAYCARPLLSEAERQAHEQNYRSHEYGDLTLIASRSA